jgi:DNA primase
VVANSGTALSEPQIRLLHRFTSNIILLYDGDAAGIKASIRGIDMLLAEGMHIKVLLLPDGDDPDSFARKHTAEEFRAYIEEHAEDFIRFKTSLLLKDTQRDPIKRAALISDMARSIGLIPDNVIRYACLRECATLLNVNEQIIQNEIKKYLTQRDDNYLEQLRKEANRVETPVIPLDETPADVPAAAEPASPATGTVTETSSTPAPIAAATESETPSAPSPAPASYQSYIPDDSREQYIFYVKELALTQTLIRFGERVVCNVEDENGNEVPLTVAEYIATDLQQDNLQFHNPLHRRILAEAIEHIHDPNFTAERYFVFHADPEVSKLAANLSSDRYQLSKYHSKGQKIVTDEERLADLVPHQMIDFKLSILEEEMKQTLQQLRQPEVAADTNRCLGIMSHYKELSELLKELAKRAGDRVILKA